jgi:hypothetical protein
LHVERDSAMNRIQCAQTVLVSMLRNQVFRTTIVRASFAFARKSESIKDAHGSPVILCEDFDVRFSANGSASSGRKRPF